MTLTGLAFLAAYAAGLGLALFRHPLFGLYTYVAVFYIHPPSRWWGEFLPDLRWSLVAAGVTLIALWRIKPQPQRSSWIATAPGKFLLIFTAWLWIQTPWALAAQEHQEAAILFTKYIILYFMVYRLVDTPEKITTFLFVHVMGCLYLSVLAFTASYSGRLDGVGGPGIDDANTLAMHLATGVIAGSMLILKLRGWRQIACIGAMPFLLNAMVAAGSRGAFLGLLAGGLLVVYLRPLQYQKLFYFFAVLGVLTFGYVASETYLERLTTITAAVDEKAQVDLSTESRLELMKAQLKMAHDYPFGAGHRGTAALSADYLNVKYLSISDDMPRGVRSSHNTFMTVLVEQGIPGAVMFVALTIWACKRVRRRKPLQNHPECSLLSAHTAALAGGLGVVLIAGLFSDFLSSEVQIWLFALLAALLQSPMPATQTVTYEMVGTDAHAQRSL